MRAHQNGRQHEAEGHGDHAQGAVCLEVEDAVDGVDCGNAHEVPEAWA